MPDEALAATLNELLTAEHRQIAPRLLESTVFVSRLSVSAFEWVRRSAAQAHRHCAELTELILNLGGHPAPRSYEVSTAYLHFQDLSHVLPLLRANQHEITGKYRVAAAQLGKNQKASALVSRLLAAHEESLKTLESLEEATRTKSA